MYRKKYITLLQAMCHFPPVVGYELFSLLEDAIVTEIKVQFIYFNL